MYPNHPNIHTLMTDAGENRGAVIENYPPLIQASIPGLYCRPVSWKIVPCIATDRWQTLSQWEPVPGLCGPMLDGLGTM